MTGLTAEVRAFLSAGTRTGKLAFTARDGRPLVAPVWFVVDGPGRGAGAAVQHRARHREGPGHRARSAAGAVRRLGTPPYAFVQVQGMATWSEDLDELLRSATAIGARYMGADRAEEFGRRNGVPGELLVRLRPTKILAELDVTG